MDTSSQHTSAYVSIRQHTAYVSIGYYLRLAVEAYVSIRQHTAYVSMGYYLRLAEEAVGHI